MTKNLSHQMERPRIKGYGGSSMPDLDSSPHSDLAERLERIEQLLTELIEVKRSIKEWYTTAEVAQVLGKRPFTVREWCRHRRITRRNVNAARRSQ